jgi:hypothetical protein
MNLKPISLLVLGSCVPLGTAQALVGDGATGPSTYLVCAVERLRAELTTEGAKYLSGGTCQRVEGGKTVYRFSWEGEGVYSVKSKATREVLRLTGVGAHVQGYPVPSGKTTATFLCDIDPWLHEGAPCSQTRSSVNGSFTDQQLLDRFQNIARPYTSMVNAATRDYLFQQHVAARAQFEAEQRRLAEAKRQQAIASVSSQTLRSPSTSTTRSGGGPTGASITSDGNTGTGTVSSALKLQDALEQQRQAQQAAPSGASQTSIAGRFAGTAGATTPQQPTTPPGSTGLVTRDPPVLVEPAPNIVVRGRLRVRADIALLIGLPKTSWVEVSWVGSAPIGAGTKPPAKTFAVDVPTADLARGTTIAMPDGPDATGKWSVRARYGLSTIEWGRPVVFEYAALPEPGAARAPAGGNQVESQALNPQPLPPRDGVLQGATRTTVANPAAATPNTARATSTTTSIPTVAADPATANAWKGGTPAGSAPTTARSTTPTTSAATTATPVQAPTASATTRAEANTSTAVTRLPSTTQRTTSMPDSAFSR